MPLKKNHVTETLSNIGFRKNCIMEIILVTMNPNDSFNAAPMGVRWIGEDLFEVKTFKSSQTYLNLQNHSASYINIVSNPLFFLNSAFKKILDSELEMYGY
jgi:hypothetical protein